jgi:hypothetical protein
MNRGEPLTTLEVRTSRFLKTQPHARKYMVYELSLRNFPHPLLSTNSKSKLRMWMDLHGYQFKKSVRGQLSRAFTTNGRGEIVEAIFYLEER